MGKSKNKPKTKPSGFFDGLTSFVNSLSNTRNPTTTNSVTHSKVSFAELRAIYKTGLGSKIIRLKSGYALNDSLTFLDGDKQKEFYENRLAKAVKKASKFQLAFGRGIVVIQIPGESMTKPLMANDDISKAVIRVFSGDMVSVGAAEIDLESERYLKPEFYIVRGVQIHHSRVVDFTYYEPPELEAVQYLYGGISEFELIYPQLVNDSIVERASTHMLEKNSTLFYKVSEFKNALATGKESDLVAYFSRMEDTRSIYGAGIVDKEDEIETHTQTLTGLADSDMITLRRLAMVTGIPLSELVGENVKGLNSSGDNETKALWAMVGTYQSDYLLEPINELFEKFDMGVVKFNENQSSSPNDKIDYETKAIDNAVKLQEIGQDSTEYLKEKGVTVQLDAFDEVFKEIEDVVNEPGVDGETGNSDQ